MSAARALDELDLRYVDDRRTHAVWYWFGREDECRARGERLVGDPFDFGTFARDEAAAYRAGEVCSLDSVRDQFDRYVEAVSFRRKGLSG